MLCRDIVLINALLIINLILTTGCPHVAEDEKAAYKSGELVDQTPLVTLESIIRKLKDTGVFDAKDPRIDTVERKELAKLFEAVEMMVTSRNRQPSSAQNVFSSLRLVERVVKKQLKEGQLSESLASKFNWDKLSGAVHGKATYHIDKQTKMRVFDTSK